MQTTEDLPEGFGHFRATVGGATLEIRPDDDVFTVGGRVHVTIGPERVREIIDQLRRETHDEKCERLWRSYVDRRAEHRRKGYSALTLPEIPWEVEQWARARGFTEPVTEAEAQEASDAND